MSHELELNENGEADMAWARSGGTPWHGLGFPVGTDLSPWEMCKAANLDWRVEKLPLFGKREATAKTPEIIIDIKGDMGLFRSKMDKETRTKKYTHLSTISNDWEPCQNEDAFRFFNEFTQAGKMTMETAGSLKDGRIIWVLAKVNESFTLFKGDKVESYLLFSNPHIYGQSINVRFTPIRVVCANTLAISLAGKKNNGVALNHRRKFDAQMVKKMLGVASVKLGTYKEVASILGKAEYTDKKVMDYFSEVFPHTGTKKEGEEKISRAARQSFEILETQPGAEFGKNTWWQAFNAVTYNVDHLLGNSDSTRLYSAWYGNNKAKKIDAFEKALEYAQA